MFSTFLQTISGFFNKRFILSAFFPSLAFGGLCLLIHTGLQGPRAAIESWTALPPEWRIVLTVAFFAASLLVAYLLEAFSGSLTRLYEGYWQDIRLLNWWRQSRRCFYQRRWDYLEGKSGELEEQIRSVEREPPAEETDAQKQARLAEVAELYTELGRYERERRLSYPWKREMVMSTRLGNIMRAAEAYPLRLYNLDAVVIWPRLQSVLPESFASGLQDAKATLDLLLNLVTLSIPFTLAWQLYLALTSRRWGWFLIVGLGWIVAILAYQAALGAAQAYGELIKAAHDLYRWDLLSALHLKKPASYSEERELWEVVTNLLYRSYPPKRAVFRYETAKEGAAQPQDKLGLFSRLLQRLGRTVGGES